jgi:prohibitin 2
MLRMRPRVVIGALVFAVVSFAAVTFLPFVVVDAGHIGVVLKFGAVQDEVLREGLHFVDPIGIDVVEMDGRVLMQEARATASSKDLQNVSSIVALNYAIDHDHAHTIYQDLGMDFERTIVTPAIQESVKAATAKFTAEELITRRSEVKASIFEAIRTRLSRHHLVVVEFSIVDFRFSQDFEQAIEAKQIAEQAALRAKNDLERVRIEAEQVRTQAEGRAQANLALARAEAESQAMIRKTLTQEVLELRTIEKWDGTMPVVVGQDGGAFFDVVAHAAKTR